MQFKGNITYAAGVIGDNFVGTIHSLEIRYSYEIPIVEIPINRGIALWYDGVFIAHASVVGDSEHFRSTWGRLLPTSKSFGNIALELLELPWGYLPNQ